MKQYRLENSPIVYYVSGTEHKEWALFLHAAFVNHNMFRTQLAYFRDQYNVLTLDLIGHGNSTGTKRGDSIAQMPVWIDGILNKEHIDAAHIAGVSLGAVVAQAFANRFPQAVKSLACFGGYDINHFDGKMQQENRAAQTRMMLKAIFSVKWFAEANRKISAYTEQAQRDFYEMNLAFPRKSFLYLASLNTLVSAQGVAPRNYPLLIGCGRHDIPMEVCAIERWKKNEPECQAVIFEGAGHCVNMDVPQQFNQTLEEFWKSAGKRLT